MTGEFLRFLDCETPPSWVNAASANLDTLLIDHANCEKKAAATAMNLMYRHVDKPELLVTMSRLAREELLHFQQVVTVLVDKGIPYRRLAPSRYASTLRQHIDYNRQNGLIDILIIGALVEARSCERFEKLVPVLEPDLARFYRNLLRSESRHFQDYLNFVHQYAAEDPAARIDFFLHKERDLILTADSQLRFHSGVPLKMSAAC